MDHRKPPDTLGKLGSLHSKLGNGIVTMRAASHMLQKECGVFLAVIISNHKCLGKNYAKQDSTCILENFCTSPLDTP